MAISEFATEQRNGDTVVPTPGQTETVDQRDRAESLESSPLSSQPIFDISAKNILEQSGKNSFSDNWICACERIKLNPHLARSTKINWK